MGIDFLAMKIKANNIDIEIEDTAAINPSDVEALVRPAVLLIMGLGMQLVAWPPELIETLVDAGYRVIRMDNRDIGLSQHFDHLGKPQLAWAAIRHRLGLRVTPPYSVTDMAQDAIGVLDALDIARAHIVGVSMGGMIAQRVAIAAPTRVLSLTSIMSSSGAKGLPQPARDIQRLLLRQRSTHATLEQQVAHFLRLFRAIGSPDYLLPEDEMRQRITAAVQRSFHPQGTTRQLLAVLADVTRAAQLARITCPTLVLHGKADPLVPFAHGEDTAQRIAGARLVPIDGMGHDLPPLPLQRVLDALVPHLQAADAAAAPVRPKMVLV